MDIIQSNSYNVYFQKDGYKAINDLIIHKKNLLIIILVDQNTKTHCLPKLLSKLTIVKGTKVDFIEIKSGEKEKNIYTCITIWNKLTKLGADRQSLMINLGGGMIIDIGGFVASCYKRGISFLNIPTTLLSMVDASIGGKTGFNLSDVKNQIGVFSDPEMVLIDTYYLNSLKPRDYKSGLAEVIKCGLIYDYKLWNLFIGFSKIDISKVIYRSIEIKNEIVIKDPKEAHLRKVLNFGHTVGHALESYFLENNYKQDITHGEAISVGIISEAYLSHKTLNLSRETLDSITAVILRFFKKIDLHAYDYPGILKLLIHDKKSKTGQINFVLLEAIEKFKIDCTVEQDLIIDSLNFYMQA